MGISENVDEGTNSSRERKNDSFFSPQIQVKRVMWLFFIVLIVLLFSGYIGGYYWLRTPGGKAYSGPSKPLSVSVALLRQHVGALVAMNPPRNVAHLASLDKTADYIRTQWQKMGYTTSDQTFKSGASTFRNVQTFVGPATGPRIVVGAHYDVCGEQPGADDNASGIAGLLELSRLLHEHKSKLTHRIDLVAYTLEEPPYFGTSQMGSAVHATALKKSGVDVTIMISLEMIGYFSDKPGTQSFPSSLLSLWYPTTGNFIAVVGDQSKSGRSYSRKIRQLMKVGSPLPVYSLNAPATLPGIDFSDHRNYWAQGYPAVMVTDTAFFRNHNYHKPTDTIDTLQFDKMADVVRGVFWAVMHLP